MPTAQWEMIWWVLGLPLLGFLTQALLGKRVVDTLGPRFGRRLMGAAAVLPIAGAFAIGLMLTWQLAQLPADERAIRLTLFDWITLRSISIPFEVLIDPLSLTMVLIITGIGSLIHLYATGYMAEERDYTRFFTYLNLFIAFMLVLVLGNNLAMLFIGWEGVGLCSYLLIGFWYKDLVNARAANKAFIVNRIGDVGLALGMFLLVALIAGNLDRLQLTDNRWLSYDVIYANAMTIFEAQPGLVTLCGILLFIGACGKSAQFPLYFWLPDAMAGPTPVSALIHAATMVTAGVFLLNRMHIVFEMSPVAGAVISLVGAFTALFAAVIAFGQTDIKKVLAYSTVSQLGFMFIGCGAGAYWTGMFHVTTHAFFKALLFLGAGAVIHAMAHNQDMRNYGNLRKYIPITFVTMMIAWYAIAGLPPLSGFWSKETILGGALAGSYASVGNWNFQQVAGWVGLFAALLTAMYMTRLTMLTFGGGQERWRLAEASHPSHHADHAHHEGHLHAQAHDHGPDVHGFFYTDAEMERRTLMEGHEHHHDLEPDHQPHEVPPSMWFPLVVLAFLSAVGGVLYYNKILQKWLYPNDLPILGKVEVHPHGVPLIAISIAVAAAGALAGYFVYRAGLPKNEGWDLSAWKPWRRSAANQFGYDQAMMDTGLKGGSVIGAISVAIDKYLIDGIVNGAGYLAAWLGGLIRQAQTGLVRGYALLMLAGTVLIVAYVVATLARLGGGQ